MNTSLSDLPLLDGAVVVFDLDDTLYPEREFVRSGFRAVAELVERDTGAIVFDRLLELFDAGESDPFGRIIAECRSAVDKRRLVETYRRHRPSLTLAPEVRSILTKLRSAGHPLGIISDGRSITQRNKIRALGLDRWIDFIVISEELGSQKPDERNYRCFERRFFGRAFVYVGNDLVKDFIAPNRLGWQTIGLLNNGQHVRPQTPHAYPAHALPQLWIERLA